MLTRRSRVLALVLSPLLTATFFSAWAPSPAQAATASTPDANTVVLDHFDGSTSGTPVGALSYDTSLTGLGQAGVFHGNFVKYPVSGLSQGTVEMWVKLDSLPSEGRGFLNMNWSNNNSYPAMGHVLHMGMNYPANASAPAYAGYGSFWPSGHAYGDTPLVAGQWTHLALSWGPAGTKFYTDGVLSSGPSSGGSPSGPAWAYLNYWGNSQGGIDGLIDEFHVSDIQRSDAYIAADAGAEPPTPPTVLNGSFAAGLSGWTQANYGEGNWVQTHGGSLPNGLTVPTPPNTTTSAAATSVPYIGRHVLFQDITLEAGKSHELSLDFYYHSLATQTGAPTPWAAPHPNDLDPYYYGNQQARIDVLKVTSAPWSTDAADILEQAFRTTNLSPAESAGWEHLTLDLSTYAGQTVRLRFADVETLYFATLAVTNVAIVSTPLAVDTTTTLASNHNPSVFGQPVTFTATVSRDVAGPTPTGSVLFSEVMPDATLQPLDEVDLVDGVATLTTADLAVGSHGIRAAYAGADIVQPSSGDLTQVVDKADTTTGLDVTPSATVTYPASQTLDAQVTATSPGAGTPTGDVHFQSFIEGSWTTFAVVTLDGTGHASTEVSLDAGVTQVRARYPGDDSFNSSAIQANLTVDKAASTVQYTGPYLVLLGKSLALSAEVSSAATSCTSGRTVRFVVSLNGTVKADVVGSHVSGGTYAYSLAVPSSWTPGVYDVQVLVAETGNCLPASTALGDDLVTVASPGDAATGGGWYQLPDGSGPAKRVGFGFTTRWDKATQSYKGNLLLVNKQAWRLKGDIDSYGTTSSGAAASGTATLYRADCTTVDGVTTCEWVDPVPVTFDIAFTDAASGKSGKKAVVVDKFALTHLSVGGGSLPISGLQPLKGGNITIR